MDVYEKSLQLHEKWAGKMSTEPKCTVKTREDLSLAYTPGVAEPCRRIADHPDDVYKKGGVYKDIVDSSARSLNLEKLAQTLDQDGNGKFFE